ncbi:TIR domain-containing protein [Parasphingorhabdus sp. JC815]|uniref:toll/interleukin-1 receptor domain-containing protein n=1 Tax=Parasphingorhabdus sp. JC815 TaxID=3232140 RepID=UPI00345897AA
MADIFISYSRNDRDRCTAIRNILEELKVSVWFDAGIGAGSSFDREIEREIEAAKALLVLWSEESVESDWVRNEARTGKERSGLIAVQLRPCTLPLEFRSVQAEVLPEGAEGTDNPVWLGILERIGDLLDRKGLVEYTRLKEKGSVADWKKWLAHYPTDPLVPDVIDNIVEQASPDMGQQLATERAKRSALEAELAELSAASKAQAGEVATNARELVRLRRELDQAQSGQADAEAEIARFREASGGKNKDDGLFGLGIVLNDKIALYLTALLWIVAIRFIWEPLSQLINGQGGLGDVFWIAFGIITVAVPAALLTIKILRKRKAMQREQESMTQIVAD